jgi:hypothetical protein
MALDEGQPKTTKLNRIYNKSTLMGSHLSYSIPFPFNYLFNVVTFSIQRVNVKRSYPSHKLEAIQENHDCSVAQ